MDRWVRLVGKHLAAVALVFAPVAVASADCNILEGACGSTKTVKVDGSRFASAVAKASQSNGKQHTKKIKGTCNLKSSGGAWILGVPASPTGRKTCEIKLLTGGKSHSRMQKRCAIWGWEATDNGDVDKSGVGMEAGRKILKQPTDHSRQKRWTVKLWVDPGMAPKYFKIFTVTLKVPEDSSLGSNSPSSQIRNYCFQ